MTPALQWHQHAGVHFWTQRQDSGVYEVWVHTDCRDELVAMVYRNESDSREYRWKWRLIDWQRMDLAGSQLASEAAEWAVWAWAVRMFVYPGPVRLPRAGAA